ncbi:hypothetical protein HPK19_04605 [Arthrobacter citreus]|nr:hypothetical protein HPK19_04605 [Arthrobacter citreus]
MARVMKGVSFNLSDPIDVKTLEFSMKSGNFSKFVKRLLEKEMTKEMPIQLDQIVVKQIDLPTQSTEKKGPNPKNFI